MISNLQKQVLLMSRLLSRLHQGRGWGSMREGIIGRGDCCHYKKSIILGLKILNFQKRSCSSLVNMSYWTKQCRLLDYHCSYVQSHCLICVMIWNLKKKSFKRGNYLFWNLCCCCCSISTSIVVCLLFTYTLFFLMKWMEFNGIFNNTLLGAHCKYTFSTCTELLQIVTFENYKTMSMLGKVVETNKKKSF